MRTIALLSACILIAPLGADEPPALERVKVETAEPPLAVGNAVRAEKPTDLEIRIHPVGEFPEAAGFLRETLLSGQSAPWFRIDYYPAVGSLVVCHRAAEQALLAELLPTVAAEKSIDAKKLLILQCAYDRAAVRNDAKEAKRIAQKILDIDPIHFAKPARMVIKEPKFPSEFERASLLPPSSAKLPVDGPTPAELEFLSKALNKNWEVQESKGPEKK